MTKFSPLFLLLLAPLVCAQEVIFQTNFESEDGFVIRQNNDDSIFEFGYEYNSFDDIPEAPNSALVGGEAHQGLKLEANLELGEFSVIAAVTDGLDLTGKYAVQVDAWLNYVITAGTAGTTEFGGLSVGHNDEFEEALSGASFLYDTDGDSGSDYRLYKDSVFQGLDTEQYAVESLDNKAEPFVSDLPGIDVEDAVPGQAITGVTADGTGGFRWMTIEAIFDPDGAIAGANGETGTASFSITDAATGNKVEIGTVDNSNDDGVVSFGDEVAVVFTDIFTSVSGDSALSFGLFDNLIVSTVPDTADPLDCNNSGSVTTDDIACATADTISDVLTATSIIPGDLDLDGEVQFTDFLILSQNFGLQSADLVYTDGDIDLSATVDFTDFLILSENFGTSAAASAVPEPNAIVLVLLGTLLVGAMRSRRN